MLSGWAVVWVWLRPARIAALGVGLLVLGTAAGAGWFEWRCARRIDRALAKGPFADTVNIYASPRVLAAGDRLNEEELLGVLRRANYRNSPNEQWGWYSLRDGHVEIHPAPHARPSQAVRLEIRKDKLTRIESLRDHGRLDSCELEPELITNLSDQSREKRRLVHFNEIPGVLVNAVLSAEDKRFFQHNGLDTLRLLKAAWVDLRQGRKEQGASTLTMQLVRSFWLAPKKTWRRKVSELAMTVQLEHKLTKQQIFELYANEVYLGRRGTYSIHGFGEAAREYFGKDIRQLSLPEAATLAGMIQRPGYFDPVRNPVRTRERRNLVLALMLQNRYLTRPQYAAAAAAPLSLAPEVHDSGEAPYFLDLVTRELAARHPDWSYYQKVYTTLDLRLQRAAEDAVREGMHKLDLQLRRRRLKGKPEVALVALDPHTGQVKALVGGRNYTASQLNRALARRQPGSTFKPFVYAAALNTGLARGNVLFTPATVIDDEPTTFLFNNQEYDPRNFHGAVYGPLSIREALAKSANIASVEVAQEVGYNRVADLARAAGLSVQPTPSVALGAYETSPLDMAGAYTIYANSGTYVQPQLIAQVRSRDGKAVENWTAQTRQVLDPRVAYLMQSLLEEVTRTGTGAAAGAQLGVPVAGKTGTSRDGWFAGFTSSLLCVVWVGFDDNQDLNMEGAHSALPVWNAFMKQALKMSPYRDAREFSMPDGVVTAEIDPESGMLATSQCPDKRAEMFLKGTEPTEPCTLHGETPAFISTGALVPAWGGF